MTSGGRSDAIDAGGGIVQNRGLIRQRQMRDGPAEGLALIDAILARGDLQDYHLVHSARGELCRRLGRTAEARTAFERALELTRQEPERRLLGRRLGSLPRDM